MEEDTELYVRGVPRTHQEKKLNYFVPCLPQGDQEQRGLETPSTTGSMTRLPRREIF